MTAEKDTRLVLRKDGPTEVIEAPVVRLGATQPETTIELATRMATALADIVEQKKLYTTISGKRFPQVEAWMTIARMDNVVAREAEPPIRHDDGSYEAFVELIRLSDGLVVGRGSALCGTKGDRPWDGRAEPQRRSMAVTRATSRAFRQQYSWIMALAGYEPTPAEEMTEGARPVTPEPRFSPPDVHEPGVLVGIIEEAKDSPDFLPKIGPEGYVLTFKLKSDGRGGGIKVVAEGLIAEQLADVKDAIGARVSCWGKIKDESYENKAKRTVTYQVLDLERITGPFGALPVVSPLHEDESEPVPLAAGQEALPFDAAESARIDVEEMMAAADGPRGGVDHDLSDA